MMMWWWWWEALEMHTGFQALEKTKLHGELDARENKMILSVIKGDMVWNYNHSPSTNIHKKQRSLPSNITMKIT
jgi:hypothetical protein